MIKWIKNDSDLVVVDKDMTCSVVNDLKVYILAILLMVFILVAMLVFRNSIKFRTSINRKLNALKRKFIYNGLINSLNIAYMESLLTSGTQLRLYIIHSDF